MSQNIIHIPPIITGYIKNSSTVITRTYINSFAFPYATTGIPYEFRINFTALPITVTDPLYSGNVSGTSGVIDGTFIKPGQWLICQNGYAYLIVKIITSDPYDPVLVIRDVDLYNALFDLFQFNLPIENPPPPVFSDNLCVIVSVSPNGIPIVTYQGVTGQATWAYDLIGRLAQRNSVNSYYLPSVNNDLANGAFDYSTYNVGEVVFLSTMTYTGTVGGLPTSITDTVAMKVDPTNSIQVTKSFGVVSAVNSPEVGNIYIRPFGNENIEIPNLPGNVGEILYYDPTDALATGTFTTPIEPASNPLPVYIKLANNLATTLYGTASGGSGGGSADTGSANKWEVVHLLSPPPAVIFSTVISTSAAIYIPWNYPVQVASGLTNTWLPYISTLHCSLQFEISNPTPALSTIDLMSTYVTGSSTFVNYYKGSPSAITGVMLTPATVTPNPKISSMIFPGTTTIRNTLVYSDRNLIYLTNTLNSSILSAGYINNVPGSNISTAKITLFITAGQPSAPVAITKSIATFSTLDVAWTPPLLNDITDATTTLLISSYTINYSSIASTSYIARPIDPTHSVSINSTTTFLTALKPGSTYSYNIAATNERNVTGPAIVSTIITPPPEIRNLTLNSTINSTIISTIDSINSTIISTINSTINSFNVTWVGIPYTGFTIGSTFGSPSVTVESLRFSTNFPVTRLFNTSANLVSNPFVSPIHSISRAGSIANNLSYITVSLSTNSVVGGPTTVSYAGFGKPVPSPVTTAAITLSPSAITDQYALDSTDYQGFYLESSNIITVNSSAIVQSYYDEVVKVTVSTLDTISAGNPINSASYIFQYDGPVTTPPTASGVLTLPADYSRYVSGVRVLGDISLPPIYTIVNTMGNIGRYYYASPFIRYSSAVSLTPSYETLLTGANFTAGSNAGPPPFISATGVIWSNASIVSAPLNSIYSNSVSIGVTVNNIYSSFAYTMSLPVIIDGPSVNLIYTVLPPTIQSITNGITALGFRVPSQGPAVNNVIPYGTVNRTAYDNTQSILAGNTAEDLQVSNGLFVTPGSAVALYSYLNYTTYNYRTGLFNTVNYSSIPATGFRYATFAWNITPSTESLNPVTFTINGASPAGASFAGIGGLLYYRWEQSSIPIPDGNGTTSISSCWVRALTGNPPFLITNYYNNSILPYGLISGGTANTFKVDMLGIDFPTGNTYTLYCRLALPMSVPFGFTSVTASMV